MQRSVLIMLFALAFCFFSKANVDCTWTSHQKGVTIQLVAPCSQKYQRLVDSILTQVVNALNRQDTSLEIFVSVNHEWLSFPDNGNSNFISIGYDTLREIDNDFIFDYYWNKESISTSENGGLNRFDSRLAPIDINATKSRKIKKVGIKIIYTLGKPDWAYLKTIIEFAAKNSETIKRIQRRHTVRYNTNGWYVSLLTIDTTTINKITGSNTVVKQEKTIPPNMPGTSTKKYIIVGLAGLFLVLVFIFVRQRLGVNKSNTASRTIN